MTIRQQLEHSFISLQASKHNHIFHYQLHNSLFNERIFALHFFQYEKFTRSNVCEYSLRNFLLFDSLFAFVFFSYFQLKDLVKLQRKIFYCFFTAYFMLINARNWLKTFIIKSLISHTCLYGTHT